MSETTQVRLTDSVADEVRALLARRRISAAKVAQELGWSQPYMARRMTGAQSFDLNDLQQIAAHLKVRVSEIIDRAERGGDTYVSVGSRPPDVTVSGTTPWPNHPIVAGMVPLQRQPPDMVPAQRKTYPTGR